MVASTFSGPLITTGNMMDGLSGSPQNTDQVAGPNIEYHGNAFPDVRYYPLPKDSLDSPGVVWSFFNTPRVAALNVVPSTLGSNGNVVGPQGTASGVAMSLTTAATSGIALSVPFRVFSTGLLATGNVLLDLGIETPTVVSASKTVTVADSSIYRGGQPIIITQVGNAAGTQHLFTYVTAMPTATTITIADSPLASNSTTCRICSALPGWANALGAGPIRPTFYAPYIAGGVGLYFDPTQAIERGVSITGSVTATGGNFTIQGYDIYGQAQSEVVSVVSGASTGLSKKAYKIIQSVTPAFTDAGHNYSVNTQDLFGFPFRNDFWEDLSIYNAGAFVTSSTGWVKGDKTSPATTTTGDPRGTYALQSASNGANRLVIYQTLSFLNMVRSSVNNPQFLYGVTPA